MEFPDVRTFRGGPFEVQPLMGLFPDLAQPSGWHYQADIINGFLVLYVLVFQGKFLQKVVIIQCFGE